MQAPRVKSNDLNRYVVVMQKWWEIRYKLVLFTVTLKMVAWKRTMARRQPV